MNNENQTSYAGKHLYRSRMARRMIIQYFLSLAGFGVAFFLLILLAWRISSYIVWQPYDPLYQILNWVREYFVLIAGIICFAAWTVITYYFILKPLRYLDEIIAASGRLASRAAEPIVLPDAMKNVQDELNLFREQALRSALLAKEAEQRKNDLIVYLAHDLKTPLTSVIGYLSLLRDEPQISPELRAKYTGIALNKAERLEDLINEFFDITRFNLTALTLEPERTNLSRMLEQITNEFNPILNEKELRWNMDVSPDIEVLCDRDKMERVFDNLIRNAVNYSYARTEILVSMRHTGQQVEICIQNHGKTIPAEKLERIFDQFFRLDTSRSSVTGGAGLGLAIAKQIAELHGGSLQAQSADESILFTVHLPVECQKNV